MGKDCSFHALRVWLPRRSAWERQLEADGLFTRSSWHSLVNVHLLQVRREDG